MAPAPADVPMAEEMPMLGLGTWQNTDADRCAESVTTALDMGYRHIDTAQAYGNEDAVGDGIAAAAVPREDIFLATKVWMSNLSYDDVIASTEESLEELGVAYLDLLYVHWPAGEYDPVETMAAFDDLLDDGRIERVGVSNFEPAHVREAARDSDAPIFANQVEMHPLLQQDHLRSFADEDGLELVAYSPLVRGGIFDVPEVIEIAEKHDASAAQVSLAWLRKLGSTAIPKATSEAHIRDNWESLDVTLDDADMETIAGIDRTDRQVHPDFAPRDWD